VQALIREREVTGHVKTGESPEGKRNTLSLALDASGGGRETLAVKWSGVSRKLAGTRVLSACIKYW